MKATENRLIYAGVLLISMSTLYYEILLTKVLSVILWYHFAFMVISIAMFGFGASGTMVSIISEKWRNKLYSTAPMICILFSLSIIFSLKVITVVRLDLFAIHTDYIQILYLFIYYIALTSPFFIGSSLIILVIYSKRDVVSKVYFSDLTGAGLSCLVVILALKSLGAPMAAYLAALLGLVAAVILSISQKQRQKLVFLSATIAALITFPIFKGVEIKPAPDKILSIFHEPDKTTDNPIAKLLLSLQKQVAKTTRDKDYGDRAGEYKILNSTWDTLSRVDVSAYTDFRPIFPAALQTNTSILYPPQIMITQDGDAATFISKFDGNFEKADYLDYFLHSFAYKIRDKAEILVIGAGGGLDILCALRFDAKSIDAVELNEATVKAVKERFNEFSGKIYNHPKVKIYIGEGRNFVKRTNKKYDVIQITAVDTWTASSQGAFVLSENFIYTIEAFEDYIEKLSSNGILHIVRTIFVDSPRETLRLCSLGIKALEKRGIREPENHIIVIGNPKKSDSDIRFASFLLKKTPFLKEEIEKLNNHAEKAGLHLLYAPQAFEENLFTKLITTKDRESFYKEYFFNVRPVSDNDPFFFKCWKWRTISKIDSKIGFGLRPGAAFYTSQLVLILLLLQAIILSSLFIIYPLYRFKKIREPISGKWICFSYFFLIGTGFMLLEISFIQKFTLFLGYPVYSLTVVIFSILIFAGMGSYYTGKIRKDFNQISIINTLIFSVFIIVYQFVLPSILHNLIGMRIEYRIFITVLLLAPLGFFMGMFLPLGIKWLRESYPDLIPWAWGINGCASVLGSIISVILAISFGFSAVSWIALGAYIFAGMLAYRKGSSLISAGNA